MRKISVQDMVAQIRATFPITDAEALYIKEVTEEKTQDQGIRATVHAHREDREFLEGSFQGAGQRADSGRLCRTWPLG